MRHHSLLAVVLTLVSFGTLACSSSDDGGGGGNTDGGSDTPTGPTADQACGDLANGLCDRIAACAPTFLQLGYGDASKCKAGFKANCIDGVNAPSTGNSTTLIATCAAAAPSTACNDLFSNRFPAACQPIAGKLADGAACGDDAQCVSKYCGTSDTAVCGKCGAAPAAGGSCATQKCGPNLVCASGTCVVPGKTGDSCTANAPCESELSCTDGKCTTAAAAEGDACALDGKGKPMCNGIEKGLFCLVDKCVTIKVHGVGEACGYDATTKEISGCGSNGFCQKAKADDLAGKCIAVAADGAACDLVKGPLCDQSSKCVANVCTKPSAASCK